LITIYKFKFQKPFSMNENFALRSVLVPTILYFLMRIVGLRTH
jgi:hypothetical protein